MLYESDVIEAVCDFLRSRDYNIIQSLGPKEKGDDIIAEKNNLKIYIEAKGETSSDKMSRRYGRPFSKSQIFSHVSKAFFKAASFVDNKKIKPNIKSGMAFPRTKIHVQNIEKIKDALIKLEIIVSVVDENKKVELFLGNI